MKIRHLLIALTFLASCLVMPFSFAQGFSPNQVKDIEKIVHDYLIKNPQVLIEASKSLQSQQQQKMEDAALKGIRKNKEQLFSDKASPIAGNTNGGVTLVEFFDYQCGHCKTMAAIVKSLLNEDKNLKVVYKELPIFGENSKFAAMAALASAKQGKYDAFHNALFEVDGGLTPAKVLEIAKQVGIDVKKLRRDMKSKTIKTQIRNNFRLAQAIKIIGTPTFVIGNKQLTKFKFIPGATSREDLQQQIKSLE